MSPQGRIASSAVTPTLEAVHAALLETTERLACELARPSSQAPQWSELQWSIARATATIHGVSALLGSRLLWRGPASWETFLQEQRTHTLLRYLRLQRLLEAVDAEAHRMSLPLIALKGAALHALGIYCAGERPMADLDLLTRATDVDRAERLLSGLGFHATYCNSRHTVFEPVHASAAAPFGEHCGNALKIELHTRVTEALPLRIVDISTRILGAQPAAGVSAYPCKAALMAHLLLHAAGSIAQRALRLMHLQDIARLCGGMQAQDWEQLLSPGAGPREVVWWAFPPLALTARYYGCVPQDTLSAAAVRCQWWLRRAAHAQSLSDVSLSNPWIVAFPAIRWSRSVTEALRYMAVRICPSDEVRGQRRAMIRAQPAMAGSSWEHLPQARRILRWLCSRPGRPETLLPVRAALLAATQVQES